MRSTRRFYAVCTLAVTLGYLLYAAPASGGQDVVAPPAGPVVAATQPVNGATGVDTALASISVTFDREMTDKSWSWAYESQDSFPELAGQPSYDKELKVNTLPVKLKPGTAYVIWINTSKLQGFKSKEGVPATPYKFTFTTK
jgi:hypothetical protein